MQPELLQGAGRGGGGAELVLKMNIGGHISICRMGLGSQENSHAIQSISARQ